MFLDDPVARNAYFAGLLDGEGNIRISKTTHMKRRSPRYQLMIAIVNTNLEVLQFGQSIYGGSIKTREVPDHKTRYDWVMSNKIGAAFLEAVSPYLIIKRVQAELGLRFQSKVGSDYPRRGLAQELLAERETILQAINVFHN